MVIRSLKGILFGFIAIAITCKVSAQEAAAKPSIKSKIETVHKILGDVVDRLVANGTLPRESFEKDGKRITIPTDRDRVRLTNFGTGHELDLSVTQIDGEYYMLLSDIEGNVAGYKLNPEEFNIATLQYVQDAWKIARAGLHENRVYAKNRIQNGIEDKSDVDEIYGALSPVFEKEQKILESLPSGKITSDFDRWGNVIVYQNDKEPLVLIENVYKILQDPSRKISIQTVLTQDEQKKISNFQKNSQLLDSLVRNSNSTQTKYKQFAADLDFAVEQGSGLVKPNSAPSEPSPPAYDDYKQFR